MVVVGFLFFCFFVFLFFCFFVLSFWLVVLTCHSDLPFWQAIHGRVYSSRPWYSPFGRAPKPGACEKSIPSIFSMPEVPGTTSHFCQQPRSKSNQKCRALLTQPCVSLRAIVYKNMGALLPSGVALMHIHVQKRSSRHPWRSRPPTPVILKTE